WPASQHHGDHDRPPHTDGGGTGELPRVAAVRERKTDIKRGDGHGDRRLPARRPPVRAARPRLPGRFSLRCYRLRAVGRSRVRSGHRWCLLTSIVVVAVLAAPTTAAIASPPAVDQYTQHLPTAGGGSRPTGDEAPVAQLGQLPGKTQAALSSEPDGQILAQIATASTLG